MNVLVTGCKGQLGNELYKIITEKKSELGEILSAFMTVSLPASTWRIWISPIWKRFRLTPGL